MTTRSTSILPELRSASAWLAFATPDKVAEFYRGLSHQTLQALVFLFEFWALDHQLPPAGEWKTWLIMGGRGSGKTRAGAEWVRAQVEGAKPLDPGRCRRIALLGETIDQAREVMVFGDSGILAVSPADRRPTWETTRKRLVWPNGAVAQLFSAFDPDSLRGPQFDGAWMDELAKWEKGEEAWDMLQFTLRLGEHPQQVVTTTPKNVAVLKAIIANATTVLTSAPTEANRAFLAASYLEEVRARYAGKRLGRQELDGVLIEDVEGSLWTTAGIEASRRPLPERLDRIVVAVDPPASGKRDADACGIVVAGAVTEGLPQNWRAWVIEDASVRAASPSVWAQAAISAMDRHQADRLVAEVNMGGQMVETVLRQIDGTLPFRAVTATRNKQTRAEPVAALYEQGRVHHLRGLGELEDQMCRMTTEGYRGKGSPDRLDALVWALTDLIVEPAARYRDPRVRGL